MKNNFSPIPAPNSQIFIPVLALSSLMHLVLFTIFAFTIKPLKISRNPNIVFFGSILTTTSFASGKTSPYASAELPPNFAVTGGSAVLESPPKTSGEKPTVVFKKIFPEKIIIKPLWNTSFESIAPANAQRVPLTAPERWPTLNVPLKHEPLRLDDTDHVHP